MAIQRTEKNADGCYILSQYIANLTQPIAT